MLKIYIDFKSPDAYLALKPTVALLAEHKTAACWLPFQVRERDMPQHSNDETVAQSHRRVRAESRRRVFLHYAGVQGIEMRFPERHIDTDLALGALAQIQGDRLPFVQACFAAYWAQQANLDDAATVTNLLKQSGGAHNHQLAHAPHSLTEALQAAEAEGVVDTPGYVIDGQLFVGREHLPWIAEILTAH
ncbi:MAG: DsbA family protein [Gammaproteobacteria bacterium]